MHRYIPMSIPDDFVIGGKDYILATIDSSLIDSTLTNFPVGIEIGDVSFMADRSSTDWQNLHCTVSGTECYVEVDVWDVSTPKAILHVKVASISSSADTVIDIRFGADNTTTYVGETGDTAAQNVWDSNFVAVYHMSQDPTGGSGCILDSTSNGNNGTPAGSMTSGDLVDSGFGKALDFDGTDDYISIAHDSSLALSTMTLMHHAKYSNSSGRQALTYKDYGDTDSGATNNANYQVSVEGDDDAISVWWENSVGNNGGHSTSASVVSNGQFYTITGILTSSLCSIYINESQSSSTSHSVTPNTSNTRPLLIGAENSSSSGINDLFEGQISEIRISNTARSAAWIKATNAVLQKTLVTLS